jgi:hypothetical protein
MRGTRALTFLVLLSASACVHTISLPLGGVASGRGRPLGDERIQFSSSLGTFTEVAGALPALADSFGTEVNPVPALGRGTSRAGGLDLLGLSYGFTDWLDVGLNFSRGLHAFVRLVGNDRWALSASPSLFRHSAGAGDAYGVEARRGIVTNMSLALLGSHHVPVFEDRRIEIYGGGTLSRYSAWIATDASRVEGRAVVPSLLGGVRTIRVGRASVPTAPEHEILVGMSIEGAWTWMRQRDGRRDLVPTLRAYFTLAGGGP